MPLADWVEVKGKHVTTIYVTHEHGDHYLGAPILLARFPDARLVSSATVVEQIRPQFATPIVEKYWRPMFIRELTEMPGREHSVYRGLRPPPHGRNLDPRLHPGDARTAR